MRIRNSEIKEIIGGDELDGVRERFELMSAISESEQSGRDRIAIAVQMYIPGKKLVGTAVATGCEFSMLFLAVMRCQRREFQMLLEAFAGEYAAIITEDGGNWALARLFPWLAECATGMRFEELQRMRDARVRKVMGACSGV